MYPTPCAFTEMLVALRCIPLPTPSFKCLWPYDVSHSLRLHSNACGLTMYPTPYAFTQMLVALRCIPLPTPSLKCLWPYDVSHSLHLHSNACGLTMYPTPYAFTQMLVALRCMPRLREFNSLQKIKDTFSGLICIFWQL